MQVAGLDELKRAVQAGEPEIVVTDRGLGSRIIAWNTLRSIANVLVVVILGLAIVVWANPLGLPHLEQPWALLARRIVLGVGILLLFVEYLLPVVRLYKPAARDSAGLRLIPRRTK